MSWITLKMAMGKTWLWLKEHWQFPFMLAWTILVFILSRRNSQAMLEVLETRKASYKKQIHILNEKHATEILKRDELIEKYHETIEKVEEEFQKKSKELSLKQRNTVKEIVINSKGDPDAVKEEIENVFNFTYTD